MVHSVANWTMGNVIVLFFSMEIFRVVLGELQVRVAFVRSNCLQYVFFLKQFD